MPSPTTLRGSGPDPQPPFSFDGVLRYDEQAVALDGESTHVAPRASRGGRFGLLVSAFAVRRAPLLGQLAGQRAGGGAQSRGFGCEDIAQQTRPALGCSMPVLCAITGPETRNSAHVRADSACLHAVGALKTSETLMLTNLPASGDSLVSDSNALAAAMAKGEWPRLTMALTGEGNVSCDDILMAFAQRNSTITLARLGDLRTGVIPGGQYYARQIGISQQVYDGLTHLHAHQASGETTVEDIHAQLQAWPAGDPLAPFTVPVRHRLASHRTRVRTKSKEASTTPIMRAFLSEHTHANKDNPLQPAQRHTKMCGGQAFLVQYLEDPPANLVWADKTYGSQAIDIYFAAVLYTGLQVTSGLLGLKQPPLAAINAATLRRPIQMTAPLAAKFSSYATIDPKNKKKFRQIANSQRDKRGMMTATQKPVGTGKVFYSVATPFLPRIAPTLTEEHEQALLRLTGKTRGPAEEFQAIYNSLSETMAASNPGDERTSYMEIIETDGGAWSKIIERSASPDLVRGPRFEGREDDRPPL